MNNTRRVLYLHGPFAGQEAPLPRIEAEVAVDTGYAVYAADRPEVVAEAEGAAVPAELSAETPKPKRGRKAAQ